MTDAVLDQLGTEVVMQEVIEKEQTPLPPPIAADDSYVDHDINLTATAAAAAAASSGDSSSNSSDSEIDNYIIMAQSNGKNRLFGRQKPLHLVLGAGKRADIILWRNKQLTGGIFGGITFMWLCFEWRGYNLVTFMCHSLILILAMLFVSSTLAAIINVSPVELPKVDVSERALVSGLTMLKTQLNYAIATFREVASGKDLKKFIKVIVSLWLISVIGGWFSFLTLFYLGQLDLHLLNLWHVRFVYVVYILWFSGSCVVFVMVLTVPLVYEKNEDVVDNYAEKAWIEIKKQYAVLDDKYLHKLPIFSSLKSHKQH
ncbi:Reticulon-like protein B1 [Linum perenne]